MAVPGASGRPFVTGLPRGRAAEPRLLPCGRPVRRPAGGQVLEVFIPPPFHERRPGLVAPVRVDAAGLRGPTRARARGPRWRSAGCGLWVPADVPLTAAQRTVEAAAALRADEAVTGWAGLAW